MCKLKNYGVILASGSGSRFGANIPKQFIKISGRTVLEHTIDIFEQADCIDHIIVVITPEYRDLAEKILARNKYKKILKLLNGGDIRKESSYIGISSINEKEANVLIHDCARPFLTQKIIKDCIEALSKYNAVEVAIPSTDTIFQIDENNIIKKVPDRLTLRCAQTPQCFKLSVIKKAHELSKNDENFTDDCGLVVKYNLADIYTVRGDVENIKITYPSDIHLAEFIYKSKNITTTLKKEDRILSALNDLKENYCVTGIKAEYESEGAFFEEVRILKDLVSRADLDLTVKIGGCEAITDMNEAIKLEADTITAPMIETPYAMKKFVNAINSFFSEENAKKVKLLINIETITGYNNFNDIIMSDEFKYLDGVVLGRGDMTGSIGLTREDVNSEQILGMANYMAEKIKGFNKSFYVGGGVSTNSLTFFKKLSFLTGFQTRKVIFGSEILKNSHADTGILKAIGFELMWLKYKQENFLATKNDEARITMLSKYNDLIKSFGGIYA